MAIQTYTEQLERVQTAIAKIEAGAQSYTVDGDTFTRADLDTLYKREERLMPLATRETAVAGGIRTRYVEPLS